MSQVIGSIVNDLQTELSGSVISRVAAEQLLGDIVLRIHNEGKDASDNPIALNYSSDPIYISLENFVRQTNGKGKKLTPRGKKNSGPFKNGKQRKSSYFKDGYEGFKKEQTGNTKVNLVLTGQLQNDLLISKDGQNFGLSFGDYGLDLYKGLENHYKIVIWYPTKEEQDRMVIAIEDYIQKKINK